jgi:hypothetical protein
MVTSSAQHRILPSLRYAILRYQKFTRRMKCLTCQEFTKREYRRNTDECQFSSDGIFQHVKACNSLLCYRRQPPTT